LELEGSLQRRDRNIPIMDKFVATGGNSNEFPVREGGGLDDPCRKIIFQHSVIPTDETDYRKEVLDRETPTEANPLC
jgi:hypothetical protein